MGTLWYMGGWFGWELSLQYQCHVTTAAKLIICFTWQAELATLFKRSKFQAYMYVCTSLHTYRDAHVVLCMWLCIYGLERHATWTRGPPHDLILSELRQDG